MELRRLSQTLEMIKNDYATIDRKTVNTDIKKYYLSFSHTREKITEGENRKIKSPSKCGKSLPLHATVK